MVIKCLNVFELYMINCCLYVSKSVFPKVVADEL